MSKNKIRENTNATWGRSFTSEVEYFLNNVNYLVISTLRLILKTGGLIVSNLIDIGFGSAVWALVIHDRQQLLPLWFTALVGLFISLVMTRAQIYFNENLFSGKFVWTRRNAVYLTVNLLLTIFDTILDVSLLAYLIFDRSPLDFFEILPGAPGMFYVFAIVIAFLSMFGDVINLIFLTEQKPKESHARTPQKSDPFSPPTNIHRRPEPGRLDPGSRRTTRYSTQPQNRRKTLPNHSLRGDLDS